MKLLLLSVLGLLLAACTSVEGRIRSAERVASENGFTQSSFRAGRFTLVAHTRIRQPGEPLVVFVEGDGLAWLNRNQLSGDPTPANTLVLELAAMSRAANVAYLARPCQYAMSPSCESRYWAGHRFAEEVVAAENQAVDQLRTMARASAIHLVGYSGGAAIATLVAARRSDVASLRTIAGNLDHVRLNDHHRVTPMPQSLNPIDVASRLQAIPQIHYAGSEDTIVPPFIAASFARRVGNDRCVSVVSVSAKHDDGWREQWKRVADQIPACR